VDEIDQKKLKASQSALKDLEKEPAKPLSTEE